MQAVVNRSEDICVCVCVCVLCVYICGGDAYEDVKVTSISIIGEICNCDNDDDEKRHGSCGVYSNSKTSLRT